MAKNIDYYNLPHQIIVLLKSRVAEEAFNALLTHPEQHEAYYRDDNKAKLISYGMVMNQQSICIILNVADENDFERIITDDPALISGELEVDRVIPFYQTGYCETDTRLASADFLAERTLLR